MSTLDISLHPIGRVRKLAESVSHSLARRQRELWGLVIFSMFSDVFVTTYGLSVGFSEANPVAADVLRTTGVWGLIALKLVVVLFGLACWQALPDRFGYPIPLALATPWLFATVVNVVVIVFGHYLIT